MKKLLRLCFLFLLMWTYSATAQDKGIKLVITNVKATGDGNVYIGKKAGIGLLPGKLKEDVLVMDADVLRVIASYKLLSHKKADKKTIVKLYIVYRARYKKAKEVRLVKVRSFTLNELGQFSEEEEIRVAQYKTTINLTYLVSVLD